MSIILGSLAHHRQMQVEITAYCEASEQCRHSGPLELERLIAVFGPDFVIPHSYRYFIGHLVCSKCRARQASITITPPRAELPKFPMRTVW